MTLGQQRHTSGTSAAQFHNQQCPLNCVFRNTCAWTCIVLGCQLSNCLAPILLHQLGQSPTSFFFDDAWTTNTLASTAGVTVIYPFRMNSKTADHKQPTSRAVSVILVPSLWAITICPLSNSLRSAAFPITRKSKCKNDYLPSPAAVKYYSHLTTCLPRHPDEFIEKCGDGHNVLARQCINGALMYLFLLGYTHDTSFHRIFIEIINWKL
ncbi:hypothetical protein AVEN_121331-1 [Araneus ventricosus]|uniref:Uncharacterized protein n=1 Tax=Araneus ventricosus TaxID=182803 RepID=A0A4Y2MNY5_ARAVE|nr:hypothetical protein AVEN_121331-1 [Araneus ventricosus]